MTTKLSNADQPPRARNSQPGDDPARRCRASANRSPKRRSSWAARAMRKFAAPARSTRPTNRSNRCSPLGFKRPPVPSIGPFGSASCRSSCSCRSRPAVPPDVQRIMQDSLDVVRRHRAAGTLLDDESKNQSNGIRRVGRRRLLGSAGRSRIRRQRGSIRGIRAVSDADGAGRSDGWPAWLRCMAASGRSIRSERSATRSKSSDSCRVWPAAKGSRRSR